MANPGGVRGFGATVVGWLIVAVIVYFFFGFLIGTIRWVFRFIVVVVLIGALLTVWFKLRGDD
ncbi:hypothetical protein [Ilumatobacter coccineus]|jgi:hypothetical protein|uniref:Uncharacterized protein n=1 Tax=Ilumatobacter coccineus (strain NBRC 103263 / KCTC 29153 / YM16-304) TaxID=1313172 RepID=A0A6C7EBC1_ILUCY|nr:hypothetical protein [Ilumatobacter coccineus]BAN03680.1 hypothetical protein YM304_33660 [Ilumatobacter coccineus YM16-304]